jgi:hypothetical protein
MQTDKFDVRGQQQEGGNDINKKTLTWKYMLRQNLKDGKDATQWWLYVIEMNIQQA